ncbi:MAG TPA: hypothetical protein [Caudoviricetes sp.]|jgi:hypothetical protein|nr:MAG TPA: hypothetical protein [Caudoviricetes sp.]
MESNFLLMSVFNKDMMKMEIQYFMSKDLMVLISYGILMKILRLQICCPTGTKNFGKMLILNPMEKFLIGLVQVRENHRNMGN